MKGSVNILRSLRHNAKSQGPVNMRLAFERDPQRFEKFSCQHARLLVDWSKCAINEPIMAQLFDLARSCEIEAKRDALFAGKPINVTEKRPALHHALRCPVGHELFVNGVDIIAEIHQTQQRLEKFAQDVRNGIITGIKWEKFTDVVNIGIGGSDLGPAMAVLALAPYHDGPAIHFVANIDGAHLHDTLKHLNPSTTLFLVASKTFTTIETMTNARSARQWLIGHLGENAVAQHFVALSTALDKVSEFGIAPERVFGFWDWVGGRYSLWSAIGLSIMLAVGVENFRNFLKGGHAMDEHFYNAPLEKSLPIVLGLLDIWHRNICHYPSRAIIPYEQRLARLPAYLQQLDMESNGKSIMQDGKPSKMATAPISWGETGTNAQHAFFQMLHQGTDIVPVEFLIASRGHEDHLTAHHNLLKANCLAQSQALMWGRTLQESETQLLQAGLSEKEAKAMAPHRVFSGNRPSITIAYPILDPYMLGQLIALYEHRTFVEAAIWNINAFDQWGVELGKECAQKLLPLFEDQQTNIMLDSSTSGLANYLRS